jgi:hypothetical protein
MPHVAAAEPVAEPTPQFVRAEAAPVEHKPEPAVVSAAPAPVLVHEPAPASDVPVPRAVAPASDYIKMFEDSSKPEPKPESRHETQAEAPVTTDKPA